MAGPVRANQTPLMSQRVSKGIEMVTIGRSIVVHPLFGTDELTDEPTSLQFNVANIEKAIDLLRIHRPTIVHPLLTRDGRGGFIALPGHELYKPQVHTIAVAEDDECFCGECMGKNYSLWHELGHAADFDLHSRNGDLNDYLAMDRRERKMHMRQQLLSAHSLRNEYKQLTTERIADAIATKYHEQYELVR